MTTPTFIEASNELIRQADVKRSATEKGHAAREYALAITALEEAQFRFNKGLAIDTHLFKQADLERGLRDGSITLPPTAPPIPVDEFAPADLAGETEVLD